MNSIVTGNSGFVGRKLTQKLLRQGYKVYGLDKSGTKDVICGNHKNFKQLEVDLCSFESVQKACKSLKGIDFVFHTAAIQPSSSEMDIRKYTNTNLIGAVNLVSACEKRGFKNFIVSSSFSVYGKPEYVPVDESHPLHPINIYGLTKLQAELLFELYARKKGFNVIILRCDGIYGANQTIPGLIQNLVESFSQGKNVELFNYGKQKRDHVYVDDAADAHLQAIKLLHKEEYNVFNIGGGEPKTLLEMAKIVKDAIKTKSKIILSKKKNALMSYDDDVFMDISKAQKKLGFKPAGLRENIMKMLREEKKNAETA